MAELFAVCRVASGDRRTRPMRVAGVTRGCGLRGCGVGWVLVDGAGWRAALPWRKWTAGTRSRCRTKSWNCGNSCKRCSSSVATAAAPAYRPDRGGHPAATANGLVAQLLDRVSTLEDQVRRPARPGGPADEHPAAPGRKTFEQAGWRPHLCHAEQLGRQPLGHRRQHNRRRRPCSARRRPTLGGGALAPSRPTPMLNGPTPRTPEVAMQEANAALARRDYPGCRGRRPRGRSPSGGRSAGDAQFVLAQAEMAERNYQQAAPDYLRRLQPLPHRSACARMRCSAWRHALAALGDQVRLRVTPWPSCVPSSRSLGRMSARAKSAVRETAPAATEPRRPTSVHCPAGRRRLSRAAMDAAGTVGRARAG